jgi:hypothetical protein
MMFKKTVSAVALVAVLGACAGRDPVAAVPVAQPQDGNQSCEALYAEMTVNNTRIQALQGEESNKRGQNIAMGIVGGILFWPALFAMDFKDAAGTDRKNVQARQQYLEALYAQKSCTANATAQR